MFSSGSAGVAGVQGRRGLDQGHRITVQGHIPVDGGDDSIGQGAPKGGAQRVPDGQGLVPHRQRSGVAELRRGQPLGVNFQQGQIGLGITAHQKCVVLLPVPGGDGGLDWSLTTWAQVIMYPSRVRTMPVPEPLLSSFSTVMLTAEGAALLNTRLVGQAGAALAALRSRVTPLLSPS